MCSEGILTIPCQRFTYIKSKLCILLLLLLQFTCCLLCLGTAEDIGCIVHGL